MWLSRKVMWRELPKNKWHLKHSDDLLSQDNTSSENLKNLCTFCVVLGEKTIKTFQNIYTWPKLELKSGFIFTLLTLLLMRLLSRVTLYYFAAPQASLSNVVFSASRNHFVTQCGQIARTRQTNSFVGGCWAILYSCAWDTRRIILGSHINTRALLSSYNYWLNIAFHSRKFFPCSSPARE